MQFKTNQLAFRKTIFLENPTSIQWPNSLPTVNIMRAGTKKNVFWECGAE